LVFAIARGEMLGPDQPIILHMLDIPQMAEALSGVVMELEDCALPLLKGVIATTELREAFEHVDYALMVGAMPRKEGMERKDLLKANCGIFKVQGRALNDFASRNVKVLVVGNPANTNALICALSAPDLPNENFTCLTRLDHNRAKIQISRRVNIEVNKVHNVVIWGNHSKTQYPDVNHAYIEVGHERRPVRAAVGNDEWLNAEFISTVQNRGAAVIAARKLSSAASAAKAIIDHMREWAMGTPEGEFVSMGVYSDGNPYGVRAGLIYSFPVICRDGKYKIVPGLDINDFSRHKMELTQAELLEEKEEASAFLS